MVTPTVISRLVGAPPKLGVASAAAGVLAFPLVGFAAKTGYLGFDSMIRGQTANGVALMTTAAASLSIAGTATGAAALKDFSAAFAGFGPRFAANCARVSPVAALGILAGRKLMRSSTEYPSRQSQVAGSPSRSTEQRLITRWPRPTYLWSARALPRPFLRRC